MNPQKSEKERRQDFMVGCGAIALVWALFVGGVIAIIWAWNAWS